MFRVANEIVTQCSTAADCLNCHLGTVDVVCILTTFQQMAFCFNKMVKYGAHIKSYQAYAKESDEYLEAALLLDLVKRASHLLDSLDGQAKSLQIAKDTMSRRITGRSPACLNQLNLSYSHEVIVGFRKLFQLIVRVFEEKW